MKYRNLLGIKDEKSFLRELALGKERNREDNLKFVRFRAEWLKRKSNKEWSKRQKIIIDEVYRRNRHLKLGDIKLVKH